MRALLIQKDVKQCLLHFSRFHSLRALLIQKDVKQINSINGILNLFESFVNSERCKTYHSGVAYIFGLRALLIQKDVKRSGFIVFYTTCLRALLIQKDVKLLQ